MMILAAFSSCCCYEFWLPRPPAAAEAFAAAAGPRMGKHRGSEGRRREKQPFSTASVACGCCSKTASKKSPAGGKHRASKGRASSKTTPKKCLTCRLKS